jgi:hypothetical protein
LIVKMSVPQDFGASGRALFRAVGAWLDEQKLVLDPHEVVVLHEACRVADRLAQLRAALDGRDLADAGAVRLLAEERQQRAALVGLLVSKLGLPTGAAGDGQVGGPGSSPLSRRGLAGARARWGSPHAS